MRILVISDIHGNLAALEAVLTAASGEYDRIWSLGDAVGYGPKPNECLERLKALDAVAIAGNHEKMAIGEISLDEFNPVAAAAARWTIDHLSPEMAEYLRQMPTRTEDAGATLVHGTPRRPLWEYLTTAKQAADNLSRFSTQGCAHGHTHIPVWLSFEGRRLRGGRPSDGLTVPIGRGRFYMNPGSVGQPRDGDPRASYALMDIERQVVTYRRAAYDIRETQLLMEQAGLPQPLITRLATGS